MGATGRGGKQIGPQNNNYWAILNRRNLVNIPAQVKKDQNTPYRQVSRLDHESTKDSDHPSSFDQSSILQQKPSKDVNKPNVAYAHTQFTQFTERPVETLRKGVSGGLHSSHYHTESGLTRCQGIHTRQGSGARYQKHLICFQEQVQLVHS